MGANYSIIADVKLDPSSVQSQLDKIHGKITAGGKGAAGAMGALDKQTRKNLLTYQMAHAIFSKSVEAMEAMTSEVFKLDKAQIEFQKVSELSGQALENYIDQLSGMGKEVARTGKPKCQAPNVGMINQH